MGDTLVNRLNRTLTHARRRHWLEITARNGAFSRSQKEIDFADQDEQPVDEDGYSYERSGTHVNLGDAFEMVAAAIYGGERLKRKVVGTKLTQDERDIIETEYDRAFVTTLPDVADEERGFSMEVKAWRVDTNTVLRDGQIGRYRTNQYCQPDQRFPFAFFGHTYPSIRSIPEGTSESQLFSNILTRPFYLVRVPFSWALAMHDSAHLPGPIHKAGVALAHRTTRVSPRQATRVNAVALDLLMRDPRKFCYALGLNYTDYTQRRVRSPELTIEGIEVPSFPILEIRHKDHDAWVRQFVAQYDEQVWPYTVGKAQHEFETPTEGLPLFEQEGTTDENLPF